MLPHRRVDNPLTRDTASLSLSLARAGGPLLERCWPVGPNTEAREVLARFNTSYHRCWPTVLTPPPSGVGTQYCPLVSRHEEAAPSGGGGALWPRALRLAVLAHVSTTQTLPAMGEPDQRVCICCATRRYRAAFTVARPARPTCTALSCVRQAVDACGRLLLLQPGVRLEVQRQR